MSAMMFEQRQGRQSRVQTVLRVARGEMYIGDILLDRKGRVWRHADTIPSDIVLKAMIQHNRSDETCGTLTSRTDGRAYLWYVVGGLEGAAAAEPEFTATGLAEAA
jgi:hypothetical protein